MIRYKDKVYEDYFIDEKTAVITDKNGKIKHQCYGVNKKYATVSIHSIRMYVHIIQAQTKYGYRPGNIVHHKDGNSLNNALSNLDYDHDQKWHLEEEHKPWESLKSAKYSEEVRKKISEAHKGRKRIVSEETKRKNSLHNLGRKWYNNGIKNYFTYECPLGCKKGFIKYKKNV